MQHHWWGFVLRGILAILFGVLTLFLPGLALASLIFLFGIYAIAQGAVLLAVAFRRPSAILAISGAVSLRRAMHWSISSIACLTVRAPPDMAANVLVT